MKIKAIRKIENYRNLSHQCIYFDVQVNFIIGENDSGKTNILECIQHFFMNRHFSSNDFYDCSKPIEVTFELEDGSLLTGRQEYNSDLFFDRIDVLNSIQVFFMEEKKDCDEQAYIDSIFYQIHKKEYSLLLFDEIENHLHPYKQRSLIKKMVHCTSSQLFIVTHSPNILLMNYKQFIRVYLKNNSLAIVSGSTIQLENKELYKHMLHNFMYLKEAMFSKLIIFVEGDTENGALPVFAKRMNLDLDEYGIGIVKLDGAESVLRCMALYKKFGIDSLAIIDRDKEEKYKNMNSIYFTHGMDFEEDIYDNFDFSDYVNCLQEIGGYSYFMDVFQKENIDEMSFMKKMKQSQLKYLREKKNALKGLILALKVTHIPSSYFCLLQDAIDMTSP
ncbi:ATP-dependent nuclease [Floccifex sp.]|uniref:ATP-dependent nuclease n=1 Tax=Floccifex sp. TaxID=2815810 RepID=UPI003F12153A